MKDRDTSAAVRRPVYLQDYRPPDWHVPEIELSFELDPGRTVVSARCRFSRNPSLSADSPALELRGENMELLEIRLNDEELAPDAYSLDERTLVIKNPPGPEFQLFIKTGVSPAANTALEGLYVSGGRLVIRRLMTGISSAGGITTFSVMWPTHSSIITRVGTR